MCELQREHFEAACTLSFFSEEELLQCVMCVCTLPTNKIELIRLTMCDICVKIPTLGKATLPEGWTGWANESLAVYDWLWLLKPWRMLR